jgi:hypothetical protein
VHKGIWSPGWDCSEDSDRSSGLHNNKDFHDYLNIFIFSEVLLRCVVRYHEIRSSFRIFFLTPFYLQAVHVHLANGVNIKKKKKKDVKRSAQQHTSKSNRLKA